MASIQEQERARYEDVWGTLTQYGDQAPGEQWAAAFMDIARPLRHATVLDAGAGSGKGALALSAHGLDVTLCDLTPDGLVDDARALPFASACLWSDLERAVGVHDWVFCCDVLEHVPTEFTMLAIARMLEVARRGLFCSITFEPDNFGQLLGAPLHLTVQPYSWWLTRLRELGAVIEARDLLESGLFLVVPR